MNIKTVIFSTTALTFVGILGIGLEDVWSDDDDGIKMRSRGVAPVTDPLYKEECGSCHFAYPPGLLPAASWQRIMAGLDDHFGDNAELDTQAGLQISKYLTAYAADASGYRRSRAIISSLRYSRTLPLRITEIPYFRHEHREIPRRIINLPDVGSLSQCNACHQRAEKGSFRESEIWIKGIGRWDD